MTIKSIRKKLGVTQKEFADIVCVSPSLVQAWEQKKRPVSRVHRRIISLVLQTMKPKNF